MEKCLEQNIYKTVKSIQDTEHYLRLSLSNMCRLIAFRVPAGNKFVHELSSAMPQVLRFDFHFSDDSHTYATYNQFYISDEAGWFSWHVGDSFNGTAGKLISIM